MQGRTAVLTACGRPQAAELGRRFQLGVMDARSELHRQGRAAIGVLGCDLVEVCDDTRSSLRSSTRLLARANGRGVFAVAR